MTDSGVSATENPTFNFGMELGTKRDTFLNHAMTIGPSDELKGLFPQLDGLIVAVKLLDHISPPTTRQPPGIYGPKASTSPSPWSNGDHFDELQEELESMPQTGDAVQPGSSTQHARYPSIERNWNLAQSFSGVMEAQWTKGATMTIALDMQPLHELHRRYTNAEEFRDHALLTLRQLATKPIPIDLNLVFILASLVYAASRTLHSVGILWETDILCNINDWIDAVKDSSERKSLVDFAQRAWPECRSHLHRTPTRVLGAGVSQDGHSRASVSVSDTHITSKTAQYGELPGFLFQDFDSDMLLQGGFGPFSNSLPNMSVGRAPYPTGVAGSDMGNTAPTESSFSGLDHSSLAMSDCGYPGDQARMFSAASLSSIEPFPRTAPAYLEDSGDADDIPGRAKSSETQTTAYIKALRPLVALLGHFDDTLCRLSGNGITVKDLPTHQSSNQQQEDAKMNIKRCFLSSSTPDIWSQNELFGAIQSVTVQCVDLGFLLTIDETLKFMTSVGKEVIVDKPAYINFHSRVIEMLTGSMLPESSQTMSHVGEAASQALPTVSTNSEEGVFQGLHECDICGATFYQKRNLTRHKKKKPHPRRYNKGRRVPNQYREQTE